MIISRTPFRISFFGGGTDYPAWYEKNCGQVLATTINKYCYITCRHLPPYFKHKHRIVYSQIESVRRLQDIDHPSVRACLQFMKIKQGMEIHHDGDMPARSGIGSSSSFTVGLLNVLHALKGDMLSKRKLAMEAIHLEQSILKENVGSQDQAMAAFGGFNLVKFGGKDHLQVHPITIPHNRVKSLQEHLMLFYTGVSRTAHEIAGEQIKNTPHREKELSLMYEIVTEAIEILNSKLNLVHFGRLMHESWQIKKKLSNKITTPLINELYSAAREEGAVGGKLLGAGGGGFLLVFAKPENQPKILERFKHILHVPFQFENQGSRIIFYNPDEVI